MLSQPASGGRVDVLSTEERRTLMDAPRPRHELPVAPRAEGFRRRLPLASIAREIDQKWRPIYAVWELTLKCDLACRHCGSRAGTARPDELSKAECLDLVNQLADLGVKEVTVIGGEAYLREDWTEILREIRRRGMLVTMTTGGRGMTAERAEEAALAGLQGASVSLDGMEATHDRLRGVRGSFNAAVSALGNLARAGIITSVNTQINRLSLPELPEVLETLVAAGARSWQVQLTAAMGRAADEPDVLLQPYDLDVLFPLLAQLKVRCDAARILLAPGNNIGYFGPYESTLRDGDPGGCFQSCGAGRASIGIEADGTIKGCPSLSTKSWAGGNVREHPLRDIWERAEPLRYTRDRTVEDLWGFCRTCYYANECRAGCTWTAEVLFGRPGNNPYCHHRVLELARVGKRERLVRVEEPRGLPFDHGRFEIVEELLPASSVEAVP